MTNYIDPYDPIFYAQEGLKVLENALGMAARIHRGYDAERKSVDVGSTIEIKRPSTFTTQAGGTGTVNDINPEKLSLIMDTWREVKFGMTDRELAYASEKIISDHISPAVYAIANYIETTLTDLYKFVPWSYDVSAAPGADDIVDARKIMRDNIGSLIDQNIIHFGIDSTLEAAFLKSTLFHSAGVAGEQDNKEALRNGSLGVRFGVESFVQQTLTDHTSGTVISGAVDVAGSLNGAHSMRATTISVQDLNTLVGETLVAGDSFVIAGNSQRYVVTDTVTTTSGAHASVPIYPALKQDYSAGAVVTFETVGASNYADRYYANIMFHRNAFALAMAPLPEIGDGAGAKMAVIQDHRTGLSMRSRLAYDDTNAKVIITLDVLYGVKCLDPNLAVICRRNY